MKTILHFDIESTGKEITTDRIIQLSLIKTDLELVEIERKKFLLSNCGVPIHQEAFLAHGISEIDLIGAYRFEQYAPKFLAYFNSVDYLHGYNIKSFDIPMLYEEFARCGLIWNPKPAIDSCVIFKRKEERNLAAALRFYAGKELEGAHDAENDVLASIEVLKGQIEKYDLNKLIKLSGDSENIIQTKVSIDEILISESKYENEDKRLTWDGKIILNDDGKAIWGFGKYKGSLLGVADLGYVNWILSGDFSSQTKNVIRSLLNTK